MSNAQKQANDNVHLAQTRQADQYNKHKRPDADYQPGDMVMINSNILRDKIRKPKQADKLLPRHLGPYKVLQNLGNGSYKLELPATSRAHNTFHGRELKPFIPNDVTKFPQREPERPGPELNDDNEVIYEVEEIRNHRLFRRQPQYLVKWKGWPSSDNTWEPAKHLLPPIGNSQDEINAYWDMIAEKPLAQFSKNGNNVSAIYRSSI